MNIPKGMNMGEAREKQGARAGTIKKSGPGVMTLRPSGKPRKGRKSL